MKVLGNLAKQFKRAQPKQLFPQQKAAFAYTHKASDSAHVKINNKETE